MGDSTYQLSKYCLDKGCGIVDYKTLLEAEDDAATMNWGREWQTPSREQFEELFNERYTTSRWTTQNGVGGMLVTGKRNNNTIFLPAAGSLHKTELLAAGREGRYTTRSLSLDQSDGNYLLCIYDNGHWIDTIPRIYGISVRPVRKLDIKYVEEIQLSDMRLMLQCGDSYNIFASVLPYDASITGLTWESTDENVATVTYTPSDGGFDPTGAPSGNFCTVNAVGSGRCNIVCRSTDGSGVFAICSILVNGNPKIDGYEYVDLGLPSGTLWATCNVGANSPEQYGDYFAWGETASKSEYTWLNYLWMRPGGTNWNEIGKYTFEDDQTSGCWYDELSFIGDDERELFPEDDAAVAILGSDWRTPNYEQFEELIDEENTTTTWTTQNGVNGRLIKSKTNGKSIFLPAAGERYDAEFAFDGTYGFYWSCSLSEMYSDQGAVLFFGEGTIGLSGANRCLGHCIRPVRNQQ